MTRTLQIPTAPPRRSTPATRRLVSAITLATIAVAGAAGPAAADVTIAEWDDAFHYQYHVNWMPDLDQRRVGLPNSGNVHCVPTSTMNMLAYAAQWGFPSMDPGPGTWTGYDDYYEMTDLIEELGELMGTDDGGTNGSGKRAGLDAWIAGQPLVADYVWRSGTDCPTLSDIVRALEGGHVGCFAYGRYDWEPGFQGAIRLIERQGGHQVTVMHASSDGFFDETLWTRDPADDNPVDVFGQSAFSYRIYHSVETTDNLQIDTNGDGVFESFPGTILEFDPDSSRVAMIDSYVVLRPISGYSYNHVVVAFQGLAGGGWLTTPQDDEVFDLQGFDIRAIAPRIGGSDLYVLAQLPGGNESLIVPVNRFRGTGSDPVARPFAARWIYADQDDFVHVAGRSRVERLGKDDLQELTAWFERNDPISAMAGDDDRRSLWLYSDAGRYLTRLKAASLEVAEDLIAVPAWFPTTPIRDLTVCPATGSLWMLFEGDDKAYRIGFGPDGSVEGETAGAPSIVAPVSVSCDDRGHVFVSDGELVQALRRTTAGYVPYDDPWLEGVEVRGAFRMDRSRSNYDPAQHDTPGWNRSIPADELDPGTSIRDCLGDVDGDAFVGLPDLLAVLSAWNTAGPLADVAPGGGDGTVNLHDLLAVLSTWGPCGG